MNSGELKSEQTQPTLQRLILTGFRATGKSAVGRYLAMLLGYSFIDTDDLICDRMGNSIAEAVARNGWQPFRDLENSLLRELAVKTQLVVATGGGAVLHSESWQLLRQQSKVVWLRATRATTLHRLKNDSATAQQRPSLSGQGIDKEIPELLAQRIPLYRAGSDLIVDTDDRTAQEVAAYIFRKLTEMR